MSAPSFFHWYVSNSPVERVTPSLEHPMVGPVTVGTGLGRMVTSKGVEVTEQPWLPV
jgi:hypothetical protein